MKLRVLDDSVRLRLERGEVDRLGAGEAVTAHTRFPGGATFRYGITPGDGEGPSARFGDGTLAVTVPRAQLLAWAGDERQVSIRGEVPLAGSGRLALLVEKDFECLDPRPGENQSNRFANPKAVSASGAPT